MTPYSQVFENGFAARHQGDTPNGTYFSLDHHVHDAGTPLDPNRPVTHAFISTTLSGGWRPTTSATTLPRGGQIQVYRYEIYAPGGIWVRLAIDTSTLVKMKLPLFVALHVSTFALHNCTSALIHEIEG
jgi:hypothetical protein